VGPRGGGAALCLRAKRPPESSAKVALQAEPARDRYTQHYRERGITPKPVAYRKVRLHAVGRVRPY